MRVFSTETYLWMSSNGLHDIEGRYYDREIPFMAMIALNSENACNFDEFYLRTIEQYMDIPMKISVLAEPLIVTDRMKEINFEPSKT